MTALPKASGNVVPLHRGYVRPIPQHHMPLDGRNPAFKREPAELEQVRLDNLASFRRGNPRFDGPAVHYRIGGCPRWLDTACRALIIAAGIVSVAIWGAF